MIKFKAGDRVRFTHVANLSKYPNGLPLGSEGVVRGFEGSGYSIAFDEDEFPTRRISASKLELAAPKSSFNVGDVVKHNDYYHQSLPKGYGGIVSKGMLRLIGSCLNCRPTYFTAVDFDCSDTSNITPPDEGEIKKEELMSKSFNNGDRVYRLGDGWSKAKHGEEGTVIMTNTSGSLVVQMDNGHKTCNGLSTAFALVTQKTVTQGAVMTDFNVTIKQQTVVNGVVITERTADNDLLSVITQAEAEIAKLDKMGTKPRCVTARIDALKEGIKQVVEILDARTPEETAS